MADDPQRNFRSIYYEKVGFRGVEEKKSLEILLKDVPLGKRCNLMWVCVSSWYLLCFGQTVLLYCKHYILETTLTCILLSQYSFQLYLNFVPGYSYVGELPQSVCTVIGFWHKGENLYLTS